MQRSLKACYLPHNPNAGNHSIEAFALAEGVHVAIDHVSGLLGSDLVRSTDKLEVIFWSDSQHALGSLQTPKLYPEDARRMSHILDIIELKVLELKALSPDLSVKFRWCPAECVEPHATADTISKNARISGHGAWSKALALFHRMSIRDMESALRQARLRSPPIHPACVGSVPMNEDAESSAPENVKTTSSGLQTSPRYPAMIPDPVPENVKTTISYLQTSPRYPAVILDPAVQPITEDHVIMNILHQAAGSSHFFSIIGGMIECLPLDLRANMQKAVHEQQDANKNFQFFITGLSNKRDEQHERSSLAHYPNLFAFIEMAAFKLPANQQKPVLAAIGWQKQANAYRAQGESAGGVYESRASEEVDVRREPEVFDTKGIEKAEALQNPLDLDESNIIEEPKASGEHMVIDGPMVLDQPKIFEEVQASDIKVPEESKGTPKAKVLDELMHLDGLTMIEAVEVSEESNVFEKPASFEAPEALGNLVVFEEPELFEEPTGIVQEPENTEEPAKIIEEPKMSEPEVLHAPMDLDEPNILDENIIEEPKAAEEPTYTIEVPQDPEILENPEVIEEARPSRIRSVWAWVERTLQRL